jgi:fatty acid desaturase
MPDAAPPLPIQQARRLVADLLAPRPAVFWADFLASLAVGYAAAAVHLAAPFLSPVQLAAWLVAGIALFRVSLFMHEIVHFRRGEMTAFKVAWNVLAGIPFLMPSFLYEHHLGHHNAHHYGTPRDGEYLPLGGARLRTLLGYLAEIVLLPVLAVARFLIGTPVSFLHPRLRQFVLERCSPLVINLRHRREIPADAPRKLWAAIEIACFLRALGLFTFLFVGGIRVGDDVVPLTWHRLAKLYGVAVVALGLNHVRTLAAHRYRSDGRRMSFAEQLDDSINVEGRTPLVELLFPVGLRYHALHHLFPSIPYHNLPEAHRRIMRELPEWRAYRDATYPTFLAVIAELAAGIRRASGQEHPPAERWFALRLADDTFAVADGHTGGAPAAPDAEAAEPRLPDAGERPAAAERTTRPPASPRLPLNRSA